MNEKILFPYITELYEKILNEDTIKNRDNSTCVELLNVKIDNLDPTQPILDFGVKKTNEKYCLQELDWYLSQSLSIIGYVDDVKIWNNVCTKDDKKEVNSNYGWCIFSDENYNQYANCLNELIIDKETKRAVMIYTRPSMWNDYNRNGMSDMMCTDGTQCFIRNNKLYYTVKQRSGDIIYGIFNDLWWHCYVYSRLYKDLLKTYDNLEIGNITYFIFSLHVYERHYQLLKKIYLENNHLLKK